MSPLHSALSPSLLPIRVHPLALTSLGLLPLRHHHHPGTLTQQLGCCSHPSPAGADNPALSTAGCASLSSAGSSRGRCSHRALEEEQITQAEAAVPGAAAPSPSLSGRCRGCRAAPRGWAGWCSPAMPSHTSLPAHVSTRFTASMHRCWKPFASFRQKAKQVKTSSLVKGSPSACLGRSCTPGTVGQYGGLHPTSGCCDAEDALSQRAGNGFSCIC